MIVMYVRYKRRSQCNPTERHHGIPRLYPSIGKAEMVLQEVFAWVSAASWDGTLVFRNGAEDAELGLQIFSDVHDGRNVATAVAVVPKHQIHFLCLPVRRARDAPADARIDHQHEFASGVCGLADRISLLPEQGRHLPPDQMPRGRVGQVQHSRQRRGAHLHCHARHRAGVVGPGVSRRHGGAHRCPASHWRAARSQRGGGVPGIAHRRR